MNFQADFRTSVDTMLGQGAYQRVNQGERDVGLEARSSPLARSPSGFFGRSPSWRGWKPAAIVVALLVCLGGLLHWRSNGTQSLSTVTSPVAFVTLLESPAEQPRDEENTIDDPYFVATRTLCYQILHEPATRNRLGAPCIVMTTPDISQVKINRLKKDGAIVWPITKPIDPRNYPTYNQGLRPIGWNKLYAWQLTQFERIVYLDNTVMLVKNIDKLFEEPQVKNDLATRKNASRLGMDEVGPQPSEYLYAPVAEIEFRHKWPPAPELTREDHTSASFIVLKPSVEMFNYFVSVLSKPGKFDSSRQAVQNFLNYVFRLDGNMPWKRLETKWCLQSPGFDGVEFGARTINEAWWKKDADPALSRWMRAYRYKMEGYYQAKDPAFMSW